MTATPAPDLRPQHENALAALSAVVEPLTPDELGRATPCAGWTLADLLAHMVGQHRGFAAAVRDGEAPASAYAAIGFTPASWATSVDALVSAFAAADLDQRVLEVELHPTKPLPVRVLLGAQLLDTLVHTWDVGASLGRPFTPTTELAAVVLGMARNIPDGEQRDRPGAAFAHARPASGDAWDQALALLGRDPGWRP